MRGWGGGGYGKETYLVLQNFEKWFDVLESLVIGGTSHLTGVRLFHVS